MTLLELIIAIAIMLILASAALPLMRATVQRQREVELHRDLREIRNGGWRTQAALLIGSCSLIG